MTLKINIRLAVNSDAVSNITMKLILILLPLVFAKLEVPTKDDEVDAIVYPGPNEPVPKFNCVLIHKRAHVHVPLCSAVIIHPRLVLTVSTCLGGKKRGIFITSALMVLLGASILRRSSIQQEHIPVLEVVAHPNSEKRSHRSDNDIGAVLVAKDIELNENIRAAKLPDIHVTFLPSPTLYWDLSNYRVLNKAASYIRDAVWHVKTKLVDNLNCNKLSPRSVRSQSRTTCASYFHEGSGNCDLDLGSALSYNNTLIGLLTYKEYCGSPRSVAVFTNIGPFTTWITDLIKKLTEKHNLTTAPTTT